MKRLHWKLAVVLTAVFMHAPVFAIPDYCIISREEVLEMLAKGVPSEEIQKKIVGCMAADAADPKTALQVNNENKHSQEIKNTGSVRYESITACGYHPQRKELTCPIEISQSSGYGGGPALQPAGSYEYVLFCVNAGNGWVPINTNGVHVHDEAFGESPSWYTTAVVPVNAAMFSQPLIGQTLRAKAILSWAVPPANCQATPVWGNESQFQIRLDP